MKTAKTKFYGFWDNWEGSETASPAPFSLYRLYGGDKYSLQDMELRSHNMPRALGKQDQYFDVWDDRIYAEWMEASQGITSTESGDAFWAGVATDEFMEFARKIAKVVGFKHKLTGARIVRFTNCASGYPTLRLDLVAVSRENNAKDKIEK